MWHGDELVPGLAYDVDDIVIGFEHAIREPVGANVLPDVFDRVQVRALGWQGQQGEIVGDDEGVRAMPARAVEDEHGMG